jgi:hypothetical protein
VAVRDWPQPEQRLFYLYARWRLGHAEFKQWGPHNWKVRPRSLPRFIPLRWRQEFDRIWPAKPPPPPPVTHRSIFSGTGMLLAWDPLVAVRRLGGLVDWVAVQAEGQSGGVPWTWPSTVAELKAAGFVVHVWEARASEGGAAVTRLGANGGYIGQNESRPQLDACMALPPMTCEKALVGNPGVLPDAPDAWPKDWYCLAEVYTNANPSAKAENVHYEAWKRGCRDISLCFGLYDASAEQQAGTRIALRAYLDYARPKGLLPQGFNGYLGETLTEDDVACLAELRRAA